MVAAARAPHTAKQWVSIATIVGFAFMGSGCEHSRYARESTASERHIKEVRVPAKSREVARARKSPPALVVHPRLLVAPEPMSCMIDRLDLQRAKERTGFSPDPKLVEIARLEEERTCFQQSAVAWRARLLELQSVVKQINCICR
jgi:hypothetical protein